MRVFHLAFIGWLAAGLLAAGCSDRSGTNNPSNNVNNVNNVNNTNNTNNTNNANNTEGLCDAALQTASLEADFLAVDESGHIYAAKAVYENGTTYNRVHAISPQDGAARMVYEDTGSSWRQAQYHRMVEHGGYLYFCGGPVFRISIADGTKEAVTTPSDLCGDLAFHEGVLFYTNTNGEIRAVDLTGSLPASGTIWAKQGLRYQNALLAAGESDLVVLGQNDAMSPDPVIYRIPFAGGSAATLATLAGEYPSGLAVDGTHAWFFGTTFSGGTHNGVGRVPLSGGDAEWIFTDEGLPFITTGDPFFANRVPLVQGSVILADSILADSVTNLVRRNAATGETCVLGTFDAAVSPASLIAAGGRVFAWYGRDPALHWYVLP